MRVMTRRQKEGTTRAEGRQTVTNRQTDEGLLIIASDTGLSLIPTSTSSGKNGPSLPTVLTLLYEREKNGEGSGLKLRKVPETRGEAR